MATDDLRLQRIRTHVQDAHDELDALPAGDRQTSESELARLNDIVAYARGVLAAADPRLVSTRAFASIESAACAISNDPRGALQAPDAHVDALADALTLLPVTRREMEQQVTAAAERFHQSTADRMGALRREVEAEAKKVTGLGSDIEEWKSRLEKQLERQAAVDKKLAEAEKRLAGQAAAADERMAAQGEMFAENESARTAAFQAQLDGFRSDLRAHSRRRSTRSRRGLPKSGGWSRRPPTSSERSDSKARARPIAGKVVGKNERRRSYAALPS